MGTTSTGVQLPAAEEVKAKVSTYYGETLQTSSDLKTSACCTAKAPPADVVAVLRQLPEEILSRYYGCGSPFPLGLKGSGLRVLDLGCGTGRDCYVCAALVGERGFVTGVDMTPAQLEVARRHAAAWQQHLGFPAPNMRFVEGAIESVEAAGVPKGSVDLVISNCVVNLSPDKEAVLRGAYAALADGGEVYFSDVYCDRRLPAEARAHEVLLGECLGGALFVDDFVHLAKEVGFSDPRVLESEPIEVHDPELRALLGGAAFFSVTFRLFKLPGQLEPIPPQDYGQTATYRGTLPGAPDSYALDCDHTFPTGVAVRVSGNTAAMCSGSTLLGPHFSVAADRSVHLGEFVPKDGGRGFSAGVTAASVAALASAGGAACCTPSKPAASGGCCGPKPAAPAPAPAASGGCCGPKPAAPAPAPAAAGGCCGPKPAAPAPAPAAAGGCCGPKPAAPAPAPAAAGGCCGPKPAAAPSNGCCPPAPAAGGCCPPASSAARGGCCAPAPAAQAGQAEAPVPSGTNGGSGGGCCGGARKCC